MVILPASPDGRDLAPRLAALLGHELLTGAVEVRPDRVTTIGFAGTVMAEHPLRSATVVTLQPGVRGVERHQSGPATIVAIHPTAPEVPEARIVEVLPPDVATMDLAEAPKILGGGNGLDSEARYDQLTRIATALDASVGTTRVITDKGWLRTTDRSEPPEWWWTRGCTWHSGSPAPCNTRAASVSQTTSSRSTPSRTAP